MRFSNRLYVLFIILFLSTTQNVFSADSNASVESIKKLIEITDTKKSTERAILPLIIAVVDGVKKDIKKSLQDELKGKQLTPEQEALVKSKLSELLGKIRYALSWEIVEPIIVKVYSEELSQEEINGILAFYASPAGLAFTNKMPKLTGKSQLIMAKKTEDAMKEINMLLEKMKNDFKTFGQK